MTDVELEQPAAPPPPPAATVWPARARCDSVFTEEVYRAVRKQRRAGGGAASCSAAGGSQGMM